MTRGGNTCSTAASRLGDKAMIVRVPRKPTKYRPSGPKLPPPGFRPSIRPEPRGSDAIIINQGAAQAAVQFKSEQHSKSFSTGTGRTCKPERAWLSLPQLTLQK
jgi:hypothetical protein